MSQALLAELIEDINERQDELFAVQTTLESEARRASNFAKYLRIAIIFLGAFAATREAADSLYDSSRGSSNAVVVIYTLLGLSITVIGSISATFRPDNTAAELKILAAECNACLLMIDCQLPRKNDPAPIEEQITAARRLINLQNEKISEIRAKAAKLGMLIDRKIRKLLPEKAH